jgi:Ca2+-binding EF-hand superfamily protein
MDHVLGAMLGGMTDTENEELEVRARTLIRACSACLLSQTDREQRNFADLDKDGSGSITFDELAAAMRKVRPGITDKEVAKAFNMLDSDQSGSICAWSTCA